MPLGATEAAAIGLALVLIILLIVFTDVAGNVPEPRSRNPPKPIWAAAPPARGKDGGRDGGGGASMPSARKGVSALFSRRRAGVREAAAAQLPGAGIRMERSV